MSRRLRTELRRRALGALRACTYLTVLALVGTLFAARQLRAQVGEQSLAVGRGLADFKDLLGGVHRVALNGETLFVASALTRQTMTEVLDRFERRCVEHSGGVAQEIDALTQEKRDALRRSAPFAFEHRLGVVRETRDHEASIVCMEQRDGRGLNDLVKRLEAFAKSGDVFELGNLRYAYVRPTDGGKTQVLTTLTEGSFNLYRLLGAESVEPRGADPTDVPRPPGSRRTLSAELSGSMYGAYAFMTPDTAEAVLKFYDASLPQRGWSLLVGHRDLAVEIWQKSGVTLTVQAAERTDGDKTAVMFVEARTTPPPTGG